MCCCSSYSALRARCRAPTHGDFVMLQPHTFTHTLTHSHTHTNARAHAHTQGGSSKAKNTRSSHTSLHSPKYTSPSCCARNSSRRKCSVPPLIPPSPQCIQTARSPPQHTFRHTPLSCGHRPQQRRAYKPGLCGRWGGRCRKNSREGFIRSSIPQNTQNVPCCGHQCLPTLPCDEHCCSECQSGGGRRGREGYRCRWCRRETRKSGYFHGPRPSHVCALCVELLHEQCRGAFGARVQVCGF